MKDVDEKIRELKEQLDELMSRLPGTMHEVSPSLAMKIEEIESELYDLKKQKESG